MGIKANAVLKKGDICSAVLNQTAKIVTDGADLSGGFVQITETITGGASDGAEIAQAILRGSKIIMPCKDGLKPGQDLQLNVGSGPEFNQKAVPNPPPADATAGSAAEINAVRDWKARHLGKFLHYIDTELTEAATDGEFGVIQT